MGSLELRCAAFGRLGHGEVLAFLGIRPSSEARLEMFRRLKQDLSASARAFWMRHPAWIESGVVHAGRFERYLRLFRSWVLPWVHGRERARELLQEKD